MDIATTVASSTEQRRFATVMVICNGIPRLIRTMDGELELQGSKRELRQKNTESWPSSQDAQVDHEAKSQLLDGRGDQRQRIGESGDSQDPIHISLRSSELERCIGSWETKKQPASMPRKSEGARAPSRRVDNFAFVARDEMSAGVVHRHVRGLQ